MIKVNGVPLELAEPAILRIKLMEPLLVVGRDTFKRVNIRVRTRGGGYVSQIYAIRQAISRGIVAYYQKCLQLYSQLLTCTPSLILLWFYAQPHAFKILLDVDEVKKQEIKQKLHNYDRHLLVSDPRRAEAKTVGGRGARSMHAKSYR